jgi:hypothetical protein
MLNRVKSALRIKNTTLFDEELILIIQSVVEDLKHLGVLNPSIEWDDESLVENPRIVMACILYAKSQFGNTNPDKKVVWLTRYNETLIKLGVDVDCQAESESGD